ncbi:MAG: 4Fe-4S dicluster domain-containing protein [Armatimonadota bacterium]
MCEFCAQHGDGGKWYLQAKNYSEDLAADMRRRNTTARWLKNAEAGLARTAVLLEGPFASLPGPIKSIAAAIISSRQKVNHFGQVVPIEDIERIIGMMNSIVRLPCLCRRALLGRDVSYCIGISMSPNGGLATELVDQSFWGGPDTGGMERLGADDAVNFLRELDADGAVHSIWTFRTPYIAAICNCDRTDCLAMRSTVTHGIRTMFKAEYVATVDHDRCSGCRKCIRLCQFGAIEYSLSDRKASVDQRRCFGCGLCRVECAYSAISLLERTSIPHLAKIW